MNYETMWEYRMAFSYGLLFLGTGITTTCLYALTKPNRKGSVDNKNDIKPADLEKKIEEG